MFPLLWLLLRQFVPKQNRNQPRCLKCSGFLVHPQRLAERLHAELSSRRLLSYQNASGSLDAVNAVTAAVVAAAAASTAGRIAGSPAGSPGAESGAGAGSSPLAATAQAQSPPHASEDDAGVADDEQEEERAVASDHAEDAGHQNLAE